MFSRIRREELIRMTQELVRIPSPNPPGNEEGLSEYLVECMKGMGLQVEKREVRPHRPNVVGMLSTGRKGRRIMFNGHIDVVPVGDPSLWRSDPFAGELRDGKIYGRGAADMKGGIAAMLVAIRAFADTTHEFSGEVIFTGVVDEESEGLGTQMIVEDRYRADMAIVGEPTDGMICIGHKGSLWFEATTYGRAQHSSQIRTGEYENAIYRMGRIVRVIEEMLPDLEAYRDDLLGSATISVGQIAGGTKANIVPENCRIVVDRRLLPQESSSDVLEEIRRRLARLSKDDPSFKVDLKVLIDRAGARVSRSEEIVILAERAVREALSAEPVVGGMGATTDMAILVNQAKIPTIIYGPGTLREAHIANEFVEIDRLVDAAKVYCAFLSYALPHRTSNGR